MKIKSLLLKNYRSYKNGFFIFHKGINAIIGDGMSGKTNVLRSLLFLTEQRPVSKKHKRTNSRGAMKIRLKTDQGFAIGYKKDKAPIYFISDGKNKQTFRKFGKSVPDVVKKAINLKDINFQEQITSPFIVTNTPSQVTKIINQITRVDMVDQWLKKSNANVRYWNNIKNDTTEEIQKINYEMEPLKVLDTLEPIMKELYEVNEKIKKQESKYYEIQRLISEIKHHKISVKRFEKVFEAEAIIKNHVVIDNIIDKLEEEQDLCIEYIDSLIKLKRLKKELETVQNNYLETIKNENICPTCFQKINIKIVKDNLK